MKKIMSALAAVAFLLPVALFAQKNPAGGPSGYYIEKKSGKKVTFDSISENNGKLMVKRGGSTNQLKNYDYIVTDKSAEIKKGDEEFAAGKYDAAVKSYETALANVKEWTLCWEVYCLSQIAQSYEKAGQLEKAIAAYTKLKDHTKTPYPNDANLISKAVIQVAKAELAAKKYKEALYSLRKAINSDDQDVACEAFLLRGDVLAAVARDESKTPKDKKTEALQHAAIAYFQAALLFKPVNKDLTKKALEASRDILAELGDPKKTIFDKKLEDLGK